MMVKIDASGKIVEINSCECNIELPPEVMGTHLKSWTYINGAWVQDSNYIPPPQNTNRPGTIPEPE